MRVHARELGVVVEHLLEVRDEPGGVRRVAVESAPELVVDPARRHRREAAEGHVERLCVARRRVAAEEELDGHRLGELRRAAPAAVVAVERGDDAGGGRGQDLRGREPGRPGRRPDALRLDERLDEPETGPLDLGALRRPRLADAVEHLAERRHAVARGVREVGAAEERASLGGQEQAHRPAALARHRLDRPHVQPVEVRALLAIHLDRDEAGVEHRGRRLVLERLALHHVAPMAGRVADREEDRAVEEPRPGERVRSPGEPVDRVVRMLEEIGTGLAGQPVRVPRGPGDVLHGLDGTRPGRTARDRAAPKSSNDSGLPDALSGSDDHRRSTRENSIWSPAGTTSRLRVRPSCAGLVVV